MTIRTMTIADYEDVYALWTGTAGMGMRSLDDSPEGIAQFLRRNPSTSFVAEEDGTLAGVLLSGHDGRRGYIYHAAVRPESRGRGTGRLLVDSALNALRAEGINKVALVVFAGNELGNGFWEAIGFSKRDDLVYRNKSINEENN